MSPAGKKADLMSLASGTHRHRSADWEQNAVLEFQKAMRLTADGMVGRQTWKKLLLP
jgi:murein L,D-transpeptidase YcbB/YkuD